MNTIWKAMAMKSKYDIISREREEALEQMKNEFKNISIEEYEKLSYEDAKEVINSVPYGIMDDENIVKLKELFEKKRKEKYPQLLKAVYYPEINQLTISDEDKVNIDKFLRRNRNSCMNDYYMKDCIPMKDNLEELVNIRILEKRYSFECENCRCSCETLSDRQLESYKRYWELENILKENGDDELYKELETLQDMCNYGSICVTCWDCDEEDKEIFNIEQLNEYFERGLVNIYYKIIKDADLSCENL